MTPKIKATLQRVFGFLLLRLQEPSTWRGVVLLMTAGGSAAQPKYAQAIITFGMLAAGLVGILFPDAIKKAEEAGADEPDKYDPGAHARDPGNQTVDNPEGDDQVANPDTQTGRTHRAPR